MTIWEMSADLRGFSQLTDELPEERIVELLNAFFDLVVPGVLTGGGDILKYVGDAVIAIFPVTGDDPTPACGSALTAAQTALAALTRDPATYFDRPLLMTDTFAVEVAEPVI